jgi:hypothetical protein
VVGQYLVYRAVDAMAAQSEGRIGVDVLVEMQADAISYSDSEPR